MQDIRIGGRRSNAEYQYTLQTETTDELMKYGPELLTELRKAPGFQDVNSDQQTHGLQMLLNYDRPTAARLGLTPQVLDQTLYYAFGQAEVSTIYTQLNQYYVVMEAAPKYWQSPEGLKSAYLIPKTGRRSDSAFVGGDVCAVHESGLGQSHRPVPLGDGVVQSGAGRLAGAGDAGNCQYPTPEPACRNRYTASSPERCRRSRSR